jgi:hypothetical protein
MKRRSFLASVAALSAASRNATGVSAAAARVAPAPHTPICPVNNEVVNVRCAPYSAKGDGIADDTRAFTVARSASNTIYVPPGVYNVHGFDGAGASIIGAGRGVTAIQGDGDLITNAVEFNIERVTIRNVKVRGKLISVGPGPDTGRTTFRDIEFGMAASHVYADRACVDWSFENCRFNDASDVSRYIKSAWALKEIGCYSWYNLVGLKVTGGMTLVSIGCVYEFNSSQAIILSAANSGGINNVMFQGTHFESNGNANLTETVRLETVVAERIRNVAFNSCTFLALKGKEHVYAYAGAGGTIARISFRDVFASERLMNSGFSPTLDNVEFNVGSPPSDALVVESLLERIRR